MTLQKKRCIATIAETQDRTGDLEIFSLTLSQLSYRGFRNKCPLQKMMRAGTHSWRADGCLGAERGRHYISEVAQWLACWAHNPKVPGSKPGFATQKFYTPLASKRTRRNRRGKKNYQAIVSQTGVWTGLQPQGCGDTERFNSSSVATPTRDASQLLLRMLGIEPRAQAWEACMLPLHYMRSRNPKKLEGRARFASTVCAKQIQLLHSTKNAPR